MGQIIKKVKRTIEHYHMIDPGDLVIVGVSGGPDSVCLLDILYTLKDELDTNLIVAHFDHGLRPHEDEEETRLVKRMAHALHLPFVLEKAASSLGENNASLEERARQARYRFFNDVRVEYAAQKIAIGHNLNDQAETVLMRLLRGSGTSGLAGIPPCRDGGIIRPLIDMTRDEIESHIREKKLNTAVDSTNLETKFLRNKIRLELVPMLETVQPRIVHTLGQVAKIMRQNETWQDKEVASWLKKTAKIKRGGDVEIPRTPFIRLAEGFQNRVLRAALKMAGGNLRRIGFRHINSMHRVALGKRPQARLNLPNNLIFIKAYERLIFSLTTRRITENYAYPIAGPGTFRLESIGASISLMEMTSAPLDALKKSPWIAYLDADRLSYPLELRNYHKGDRFIPLGMSGHRKLQDVFVDLKIPSALRARFPILAFRNCPVWVCGFRIDDRYKVSETCKKILKVDLKFDENSNGFLFEMG